MATMLVAAAWRVGYLGAIETNPTIAWESIGLGIFCLWTGSRAHIAFCLLAGLALKLLGPVTVASYWPDAVVAILGLSGFCGFSLLAYWVISGQREPLFRVLAPAAIFILLTVMLSSLLRLAAEGTTHRYDLQIYSMDRALWGDLGPLLARLLVMSPWAANFADLIYYTLPGVMLLVFAFYTYERHGLSVDLFGVYLTIAILGFLMYFVLPASGPRYAFGRLFPFSLPPAAAAAMDGRVFQSPPNAMPSLHFANALVLYLNSKPWCGLRAFTLIYMLLTGITILANGEHYVTDLVVAVPFVAALQSFFGAASNRVAVTVFCGTLVCIWALAIRTIRIDGAPHWLLWILTASSLICPLLLRTGHRPRLNSD